jgi:hypothetical protein
LASINLNADNNFLLMVDSLGRPLFQVTAIAATSNATASTAISVGAWYAIGGVAASATDRKIYVNGVEDGSSTTSRTPLALTTQRIGADVDGNPGFGSLAEVAVWNVALSADDMAALAFMSPLLIRPDALVSYLPLLDSGALDYMAAPATVTGVLVRDNDHPRVIYPRRRNKVGRFGAATDFAALVGPGWPIARRKERKWKPQYPGLREEIESTMRRLRGDFVSSPVIHAIAPQIDRSASERAKKSIAKIMSIDIDVMVRDQKILRQFEAAVIAYDFARQQEDEDEEDLLILAA